MKAARIEPLRQGPAAASILIFEELRDIALHILHKMEADFPIEAQRGSGIEDEARVLE